MVPRRSTPVYTAEEIWIIRRGDALRRVYKSRVDASRNNASKRDARLLRISGRINGKVDASTLPKLIVKRRDAIHPPIFPRIFLSPAHGPRLSLGYTLKIPRVLISCRYTRGGGEVLDIGCFESERRLFPSLAERDALAKKERKAKNDAIRFSRRVPARFRGGAMFGRRRTVAGCDNAALAGVVIQR